MRILSIHSVLFIACFLIILAAHSSAQAQPEEKNTGWIKMTTPSEGAVIIAKRPVIKCLLTIPFKRENLLVMLDETDVTEILDVSKDGFEFKPIQVLEPGGHRLSVTLTTPDKKELRREFSLTIRHSRAFETMSSANDISILYEGTMKSDLTAGEVDSVPGSKIEANISSNSKIMEKNVEVSLTTNIRFYDQSTYMLSASLPQRAFTIANYLLSAKYQTDKSLFLAETGDVSINETQNTVGLSRRGTRANFGYGNFRLNTFSVKAQQVSGLSTFDNDTGLMFDPADKIEGISGEVDLLERKTNLKVIHVRGQDRGTSYGSWSAGGGMKGDTTGFVLKTDFFSQKLTTEMEYDIANFDQDTSDSVPQQTDKAYKLKIGGQSGTYNYEGLYEFFGPKFSSIGNTGVPKDKQGFALRGGGTLNVHSVNLFFSRYNDNVEDAKLLPKIYTTQGSIDYSFNKYQSIPMGISYQRTHVESKDEPDGTVKIGIRTNNLTGRINFVKNAWNLGFNVNYASQDDQYNGITSYRNVSLAFAPTYFSERFAVTVGLSYNRLSYDYTKVLNDTFTANVNIRGRLLNNRLDYEAAYAANRIQASDNSTGNETKNFTFRIGYLLAKYFAGFVNPTIGIRGNYSESHNRIIDSRKDSFYVFVFFSTNLPVSF